MLLDRLKATGCIFALFLGVFAFASAAQAGPEDGRIVNGSGSISQSGTHTDIRQNSDFLATHWGSFNIAAHESVQAHQPAASSRLLIRVDGGAATNIAGNYTSNGITILENQNGVQFSRGAIVNVGGLLATSSRISGVAGANWQLDGTGGAVANHGTITAGAGGAILAAVKVQNTGDITAKGGDVALGAGSSFTVDFAGSMVGFEIRQAASGASITNSGKIEAQGGVVALSAQEAQAVRTNVVSVGGVVKATRIERRGGVVYLSGGDEGIAEVSGDVSASEKVQTTGEYVVVKEGALLKAPEILVGGDFQGRGDVQTAKRTLVERGALLDAGAEGRVIVWSDDVTWFNGNISAPGGFAEVSGKQTLASVNLAGIDVGKLLLDPVDIIIAATGTAVSGNIAADDTPSGTLTLAVASINNFPGALTLAASDRIRVNVAILKPTGGLTLTAGSVLTISANITTSAGDLALTGTNGIVLGGNGTRTLEGSAVTLTGAITRTSGTANLTIRASGNITINDDINLGEGFLTLTAGFGSNIVVVGTPTLTANRVLLTQDGAFGETAPFTFDANTNRLNLETRAAQTVYDWMIVSGRNLLVKSSDDITVSGNVDIGRGQLGLFGRNIVTVGTPTLTAREVNLIQRGAFVETAPFIFADSVGALTLRAIRAAQTVYGWMVGTDRSLSITASGDITINSDIDIGSGNLVLGALGGNNIVAVGKPTLTAVTVFLAQGDAFAETAPFMFADSVTSLTLAVFFSASTGQTVYDWMTSGNRALDLTATRGVITVNGNIDTGSGALSLTAANMGIVLGGTAPITLSGGAVTLTGALTSNNDLTITASGRLTLNSGINLGTGILNINAGERINVANENTVITAGTFTINFTDSDGAENEAAGFTIGNTATLGNLAASSTTPTFTFANAGTPPVDSGTPTDDCIRNGEACSLIRDNANLETADHRLESDVSITIDIGSGTLSFGGPGVITIEADTFVSITAGNINLGRSLKITANGGVLTLNTSITATGELILSGSTIVLGGTTPISLEGRNVMLTGALTANAPDLTVTATTGALTLNDNINTGTGDLTLSGTSIVLGGTAPITLSGGAVTLTGAITRTDNAPLTITASGRLTLNSGINLGVGALMINAGERINLVKASTIIRAGTFTINFTDPAVRDPDAGFTIGGSSTLGNLAASSTTPTFTFTNSAPVAPVVDCVTGDGACMLGTGATINLLTDDADLASSDSITISIGSGTLTFGGGLAPITIEAPTVSITAGNIDIGTRALTIIASGGALTLNTPITADVGSTAAVELTATGGALELGGNINVRLGVLTLSSIGTNAGITLNSDMEMTAGSVVFAAVIDGSVANADLTVNALAGSIMPSNNMFSVQSINLGTGNLIFAGSFINLARDITLTSRNVTLTGRISESGFVDLTINATGVLTLNSNINTGTGDLTLNGGSIVLGGDIELDGGAITLTGVINEFANTADANGKGGNDNLTVRATGVLTLNSDIDTGTGNIILSGMDVVTAGSLTAAGIQLGGDITLSGGAVTLTGAVDGDQGTNDNDLTIWVGGGLTLNSNINLGTGNLTLIVGTVFLLAVDTRLTGGNVALSVSSGLASDNGSALRVDATGDITLDIGIGVINLGTGRLELNADADKDGNGRIINIGTPRQLTAGVVVLQQAGAFAATSFFATNSRASGNVDLRITTASSQTIHPWMVSLGGTSLSLGGEGVALTSITTTAALDFGTTAVDLRATTITLDASLTAASVALRATTIAASGEFASVRIHATSGGITTTNITLTGAAGTRVPGVRVDSLILTQNSAFGETALFSSMIGILTLTTGTAQTVHAWMVGTDPVLTLTAGGDITIGGDIDVRTNDLTLITSGNIVTVGTPMVTAGTLSLTQAGAFADNLFTMASLIALTLETTGTDIDQTVHAWMVGGTNRALSLTTTGVLTIGRNINTGSGNLTLSGNKGIKLSGATTLTGGAITLTGAIDESGARGNDNLTITATGDITINDDINLGPNGELTLFAGMGGNALNRGNILSDPDNTETLTAGTVSLRQIDAFDDTFSGPDGTFRIGISTSTLKLWASDSQGVRNWMVVSNRSLSITSDFRVTVGRDIDLGTGDLTLGDDLIVITGARTLSGGAIKLEGKIRSSSGTLTVTATDLLTLNHNINVGTGDLALSGGSIVLVSNITLDGGAITLTGAIDGSSTGNDSLTIRASGVLTLNDNINTGTGDLALSGGSIVLGGTAPITLSGGAVTLTGAINPFFRISAASLTVTATGQLTLNSDIKTGRRIDLTLSGRTITLGGTINLSGGAITLTGAIDASDDGYSFTITADGGNITINNSINLGEGILNLGASGFSEVTGSGTPTLTASTVALRNGVVFSQNAQFRFATNTLSLTVGGIQTVYDWMVADGRNLRLRANGGVIVTGDINIGSATLIFEVCCGNIHAIGTGTPTLTAGAVSFTQSGDFAEAALFRFASSVRALNLTTDALNLPPGVETQAVHGWMVADGRSLSLTTTFGAIMVNADINTGTGNLTLSGSSGISINGARTLSGRAITLTGAIDESASGNDALTVRATRQLTLNDNINTGTGGLTLASRWSILLNENGDAITLSGGAVTLTGAVTGTANLTITASGILTIENDINIGANTLTLTSGVGAIVNGGTDTTLTASTVSLEQDAVFTTTEPFAFGNTGSLELTTDAAQVVHDWMIADGRNLTVTSALNVVVRSAIVSGNRNLGDGNITLTSTGGLVRIFVGISTMGNLTLSGNRGINLNSGVGAKTLRGEIVTLIGDALSNRDLTLTANTVRITQDAVFGETGPGTMLMFGTAPDSLELTTDAAQVVHDWMIADGRNLTVTSALNVIVRSAIVSGDRNLGDGSLTLVSTGGLVRIFADISTTGNITLNGADGINFNNRTAKTLSGATVTLTGVVVSNRDLALTASGTLRFNNNITLNGERALSLTSTGGDVRILGNITTGGDLTLNGNTGIDLRSGVAKTLSGAIVTLTGMVVSNRAVTINASGILRLNNNIALTGTRALSLSGSGGITLGSALTTLSGGAITLRGAVTGTADLTITARGTLTIHNDIDIGTGALTLTSTGGAVRILANISTGGDLTLNGATGINLRGGVGAKTLNGAIVTLTGAARSNRDLTLTATTFALGDDMSTINVVGANVLTINAGSNLPASLTGNGRLTAGTLTLSFTCPDATCVDITP